MALQGDSYPQFHVTGPVHHFVRTGAFGTTGSDTSATPSSKPIWYLGTCETTPILRINRYSRPIFNDIGGRSVPMQETHDGHDADIGLLLTRFSQKAYQILQAYPATGTNTAVTDPEFQPGVETLLSRGALVYGPRTFELWQFFSYYGSAAQQLNSNMPIGYYWPQVKLGQHALEAAGSEGEKLLLTCKGTPRWVTPAATGTTGVTGAGGRFVLYSQSPSDFPAETQKAY
jgi:hypothetical protein